MNDQPSPNDLIVEHPARAAVLSELHARPFASMETPRRILHYAYVTDAGQAAAAVRELAAFCSERSLPAPAENARHHRVDAQGAVLRFERFSEFCSYTWEFDAAAGGDDAPFRPAARDFTRLISQLRTQGQLMVMIDLHVVKADRAVDEIESVFGTSNIAASEVDEGMAVLATDFRAPRQMVMCGC